MCAMKRRGVVVVVVEEVNFLTKIVVGEERKRSMCVSFFFFLKGNFVVWVFFLLFGGTLNFFILNKTFKIFYRTMGKNGFQDFFYN